MRAWHAWAGRRGFGFVTPFIEVQVYVYPRNEWKRP